jgi:hypothetical protein
MTLITKGMGVILKKALGKFKKGQKVKEISYSNPHEKGMRKIFRNKLELGSKKKGKKPEEIVSFDTKKVYVKDE